MTNVQMMLPYSVVVRRVGALLVLLSGLWLNTLWAQENDASDPAETTPVILNINSADADTLAAGLLGIGLVKAQEIVRYREMFGDFVAIEELADVKGVGMATVEKNRHRIVLSTQQESEHKLKSK